MDSDSLKDVLVRLGCAKIRPLNAGARLQANCPLAPWRHEGGTDRHPSFTATVDDKGKSWCTCFTCGLDGGKSIADVVKRAADLGAPLNGLVEEVIEREKILWKHRSEKLHTANMKYMFDFQDPRVQKQKIHVYPEACLDQFPKEIHPYILKRGVTVEVAKKFGIRWDPEKQRVVFPVRDEKARLIGVQGRALDAEKNPPKFDNYWHFPKGKYLYGMHEVRPGKPIIVMEGIIDVLVWTGYGIPNCVAILGSKPTKEQLWKIGSRNQSVCMAFDGDDAGRLAEKEVIDALLGQVRLFRLAIPDGNDPKDLTARQAEDVVHRQKLVLRADR